MTDNKLSCLINRIKNSCKDVRIDNRERVIYFDHSKPEQLNDKKIKRLRREFNFNAQSEIR